MPREREGFTLIELMVVCLIIGILAALSMPQFLKTVETSKADTGSSLVKMVGTTNRMYALDHSGTYMTGTLTTAACSAATACDTTSTNPCNLVWCKYLGADDWTNKPYSVAAVDPINGTCPLSGVSGTALLACAKRQNGSGTYAGWGYTIDNNGKITAVGGAPNPP